MITELGEIIIERDDLREKLRLIRTKLQDIVCTEGCDKGVIFLSAEGASHEQEVTDDKGKKVMAVVFDHQYFSPLGDALIELYELTGRFYE